VELITDVKAMVSASELAYTGFDRSALDDLLAGPALRAYLVLTEAADRFTQDGWSPESVFWSRYYWFKRFAVLRARTSGFDAGLEQQVLAILESPYPACSPDWANLEVVERQALAA
jgi:hypothetical protein